MPESPQVLVKWDPKNLEIRTKSVEKALEPLVFQVTTLVNKEGPSRGKKGKSKGAHVLVDAVDKATQKFIEKGEEIAQDNPDIKKEMLEAVEEVKNSGTAMKISAKDFADEPSSSVKRSSMVRSARNHLSSVTRLLILADMVDVHRLVQSLQLVKDDLSNIEKASSQIALLDSFKYLNKNANHLLVLAIQRQADLKDDTQRDELAAARAVLKKSTTLLLTASKAYIRHPELSCTRDNRDFAIQQMCEAVAAIKDIAEGKVSSDPTKPSQYEGPGPLAAALDDFENQIVMDPASYEELRTRPKLEENLESIISGAALLADSGCTRDDRKNSIVDGCNAVRQALQDLLQEYMENAGKKEPSSSLVEAIENTQDKTEDLREELRMAVIDHISDSFLETLAPLYMLTNAAKTGKEKETEECVQVFSEHAKKLVQVANLACSISNSEEGVKMVKVTGSQFTDLCPQVIHSARAVASRPRSQVALENMNAFKNAWENLALLLTDTVDNLTSLDEYLAVSESHILEDVNRCIVALQEGDADTLDSTAALIRGRTARVGTVVTVEMGNYEHDMYTDKVIQAVKVLQDQAMPKFGEEVQQAVTGMSSRPPLSVDENNFLDASQLVYDGVRDVRKAVLIKMGDELEEGDYTLETQSKVSAHTADNVDEYPNISGVATAQDAMRKLKEEDKEKIREQVEGFQSEKERFDREVAKWDAKDNDIVVLAKHMCMIMLSMTDFTRGRGKLKTTMDVISAAKKISQYGTKLNNLANQIAEQCPASNTKQDLHAYLGQIDLYCNQLSITSKVKADVQDSSEGELLVNALETATSLIVAAKNLMNAVVSTVKMCYVASNKYQRQSRKESISSPIVVWRMKAPEKKPLVRTEKSERSRAILRRESLKRIEPIKALSEFQSPADIF